jgi:3-oxoacyl-[acyl-carrier-protein] synthase II
LSASSACSTSSQAMILGWELLQSGLYDCVIAGGADELHYMSAATFDIVIAASRKYNHRPEQASRPFDRDRDGLVVSEGAGIVVLETEERVRTRGAQPLAELKGGAYFCDGSHMSQSSGAAMKRTMEMALRRADLAVGDIDYINAHATGTLQGDREEAQTIRNLFGSRVPVSSLKGHFGHSLAACGAIEAIAAVQMIKSKVIVPTRNLENPDTLCLDIDLVREQRLTQLNHILSNNFAFGGMNTSLLIAALDKQ